MNIVAFLELPEITDYPLNSPYYFQSYKELSDIITTEGENFYIVRHQSTYKGNGLFTKSWRFVDNQLVETGEIHADVIYDKGKFQSDETVPVLNCTYINDICTDKWMMYEKFGQYCPRTWKIHTKAELDQNALQVTTKLAVVKPIDGEEGKGVYIDTIDSLLQRTYSYPLLLQEFIDTSHGIPGITEGLHDCRIVVLNGTIVNAYYRTPPQGSYLANVAQGGKQVTIPTENIPEDAKKIVLDIDSQLKSCGTRYYGIDFGFTNEGPKIIEMNSRLGLDNSSYGQEFVTLMKLLAKTLISMGHKL